MAYIDPIAPENAKGIVQIEYEKGVRRSGRVYNILKIMSQSPEALQASMRMYLAIMFGESDLSRAQREMLATVVSQTNDCFYWIESHGEAFRAEAKNDALADQLKQDWKTAELNNSDRSLCQWAEKLTQSPDKMTQADVDFLKQKGFSQSAISDAAQVTSYFNYINRIADGLGVDLEAEMEKVNENLV